MMNQSFSDLWSLVSWEVGQVDVMDVYVPDCSQLEWSVGSVVFLPQRETSTPLLRIDYHQEVVDMGQHLRRLYLCQTAFSQRQLLRQWLQLVGGDCQRLFV